MVVLGFSAAGDIYPTVVTSSRETEDHHLPLPGNALLIGNVIETVPCTTRHRTPQVRPGAPLERGVRLTQRRLSAASHTLQFATGLTQKAGLLGEAPWRLGASIRDRSDTWLVWHLPRHLLLAGASRQRQRAPTLKIRA